MIVIIDYGLGNPKSIQNMLRRAGVETAISDDPDDICTASKIILPGIGHFGFGMDSLRRRGLLDVVNEWVMHEGVPSLGIFIGAQLLGREGDL